MICRATFHWLHADWEYWADAKSEPTKNSDTSISLSIEAHKDRKLRLLNTNESRELFNWTDDNNADDDGVDDDADNVDNDDDDEAASSKFDTVDTDAKQREMQGPDPWDNPIILVLLAGREKRKCNIKIQSIKCTRHNKCYETI